MEARKLDATDGKQVSNNLPKDLNYGILHKGVPVPPGPNLGPFHTPPQPLVVLDPI